MESGFPYIPLREMPKRKNEPAVSPTTDGVLAGSLEQVVWPRTNVLRRRRIFLPVGRQEAEILLRRWGSGSLTPKMEKVSKPCLTFLPHHYPHANPLLSGPCCLDTLPRFISPKVNYDWTILSKASTRPHRGGRLPLQ